MGLRRPASAVVPGFDDLLRGNKAYLVLTSLIGLLALVGGAAILFAASGTGLTVVMAAMAVLWAVTTAHHLLLAAPLTRARDASYVEARTAAHHTQPLTARAGVARHRGPLTLPGARLGRDPRLMKKLLIAVAVLTGIAFLAKRFAPDLSKIDWEKKFEAMPDNAPPKWMFTNIGAIRDNTERIIELLEGESAHELESSRK